MTKFAACLDYLEKHASEISRAPGFGRIRQLVTGSRANALKERAEGVHGAAMRAWRDVNNPESLHAQGPMLERMSANSAAAGRAARESELERSAVRAVRGIGAGALGAGAIGAAAHFGDPEPHPDAPPEKKSPLWEGAKVLGTSMAGFGLGQLAGAGLGHFVGHGANKAGVDPLLIAQKVAPVAGAAAGVLYPMWKSREQKEITDAVEGARDQNERLRLSR
jgi:hypothetical protein